MLIEVNPRHTGFYRRLSAFERVGPERACARVGGAPAVLLRGRLDVSPDGLFSDERSRRRHPHAFFGAEEAERASAYLTRFTGAMPRVEAEALGLSAAQSARP